MAKRNVIIFLIFVSSCLLFSPAQMLLAAKTGNSDTPLTLGEAITMGLANNPRITAVQSQVDASKARVSQARSGFFPLLDISQSFNRTTNPMWAFGTKLNQEIIMQHRLLSLFAIFWSLNWPRKTAPCTALLKKYGTHTYVSQHDS